MILHESNKSLEKLVILDHHEEKSNKNQVKLNLQTKYFRKNSTRPFLVNIHPYLYQYIEKQNRNQPNKR